MAPRYCTLGGIGLHSGLPCMATLRRMPGPLVFVQDPVSCALDNLVVARTDLGVQVVDPSGHLRIDLVEHLMAAIGGLSITSGVSINVKGVELPLLDGAAAEWTAALLSLGLETGQATMTVKRPGQIEIGRSTYTFAPSQTAFIAVDVEFDHHAIPVAHAEWDGDREDFARRIAPARTFGFLRNAGKLLEAGRARGCDIRNVIVLCDDGTCLSDPQPEPDECVRHKLLDLIGDITLRAGVIRGAIRANRPGHGATHAALSAAISSGVLVKD